MIIRVEGGTHGNMATLQAATTNGIVTLIQSLEHLPELEGGGEGGKSLE